MCVCSLHGPQLAQSKKSSQSLASLHAARWVLRRSAPSGRDAKCSPLSAARYAVHTSHSGAAKGMHGRQGVHRAVANRLIGRRSGQTPLYIAGSTATYQACQCAHAKRCILCIFASPLPHCCLTAASLYSALCLAMSHYAAAQQTSVKYQSPYKAHTGCALCCLSPPVSAKEASAAGTAEGAFTTKNR